MKNRYENVAKPPYCKDYLRAEVLCWPLETGTRAGTLIRLHLHGQSKGRQDQKSVRMFSGEHVRIQV